MRETHPHQSLAAIWQCLHIGSTRDNLQEEATSRRQQKRLLHAVTSPMRSLLGMKEAFSRRPDRRKPDASLWGSCKARQRKRSASVNGMASVPPKMAFITGNLKLRDSKESRKLVQGFQVGKAPDCGKIRDLIAYRLIGRKGQMGITDMLDNQLYLLERE